MNVNQNYFLSMAECFTIITVNTHFKMTCMNKLEKNNYRESSFSITDSSLTTFNLPSYWSLTTNSNKALVIPELIYTIWYDKLLYIARYAPYVILKFDGMHDLIFCTYSYGGEGRYPMVVVNSTIDTRYAWSTYDITEISKKRLSLLSILLWRW